MVICNVEFANVMISGVGQFAIALIILQMPMNFRIDATIRKLLNSAVEGNLLYQIGFLSNSPSFI